jgi:hypothetical protein
MNETGVQTELLNVKISHIPFEGYGQRVHTANGALRIILQMPEVLAFMKLTTSEGRLITAREVVSSSGKRRCLAARVAAHFGISG